MIILEDSPGTLTCELSPTELEAWNEYDTRDYKDSQPKRRPLKWRAVRTAEERGCKLLIIVGPAGEELDTARRNHIEYWEWGYAPGALSSISVLELEQKYGLRRSRA